MKIDLSGKLAIVSGSTAGIGLGISKALAESGATVVVIGRETAKVEQALASIRQQVPGAQVRGLTADLGTAEGAEKLFAAEPRADILVNNLGIYQRGGFLRHARQRVDALLRGQRDLRCAPVTALRAGHGQAGLGAGDFPVFGIRIAMPAGHAQLWRDQSANLAVSHGLAKRLAGTGVTVNAILPGPTFTDGVEHDAQGCDCRVRS